MTISVDGFMSRFRRENGAHIEYNEAQSFHQSDSSDELRRLKEVTGNLPPRNNGAAVEKQFVLFEDEDPAGIDWSHPELAAVHQVALHVQRRRSPGSVAQAVLQVLEQTLELDRGAVLLVDRQANMFRPLAVGQAGYGNDFAQAYENFVKSHDLQLDQGIAGIALREGRSFCFGNVPKELPKLRRPSDLRSVICVPIIVEGMAIGVIIFESERLNAFSETEKQVLEAVAIQLALALQNAHLFTQIQKRNAEAAGNPEATSEANEALLEAEARSRLMVKELRARNEELNAFNHTVAHDLKNPLSILLGFAEVLSQDYSGGRDEVLGQGIRVILENGRRMENIINELLLLAEVRELDEIEVVPLDMTSIVVETRRRLSNLITEQKAEIIVPATWPEAVGHPPWVEEIWVNYLSNAIRYGGSPPKVILGANTLPSNMAQFWVQDNGPGIAPEDVGRLFVPFSKLQQVNTKGHGLGLSIVQRITAKLGGEVGVESETGQGSRFWFTLPMS